MTEVAASAGSSPGKTAEETLGRQRIEVRGVVQGVGFRPFVYNLARGLGLSGYVLNSSAGVTIEVEGNAAALGEFRRTLERNPPALAQIAEIAVTGVEPQGEAEFTIRASRAEENEFVLISPDVGTCEECWRDFSDRGNRRYGYAFTNCTNCGPRYTIIRDIPYDRPKTTMAAFRMCALCEAEYADPADRRFHAQPNACPVCGPSLTLVAAGPDRGGGLPGSAADTGALLSEVRRRLHEGAIVAVKGLGGFLLACDAKNDAAVERLRARKRRSDKPFAVMARDIAAVERFCVVTEADRRALENWRRPIVILPRRAGAGLSQEIAPGNETIGVMLPYTPLHYLLFGNSAAEEAEFEALVMTSGNLSDEPIVTANDEAWQRLGQVADFFLFHNRDIYMRADDSVVRTFAGGERVLRRSRGYVPQSVDLGVKCEEVLACGAELKNTLCLTKDRFAILSQHIGDLENYETLRFFEQTLENLKRLFRVEPRAVAHDLHPGYMSTRLAQGLSVERKLGVQHHHAHIASCMAENHLREKVIGVAFDGTGYGTDGKIWGGEFLVADYAGFERRAHLRYVGMAGGDRAVREPWRMALSYVRDALGAARVAEHLALWRAVPEKRLELVETMLARGVQTVETSSCGRLFDAVAALLGIAMEVSFEGQAAMALEGCAERGVEGCYPYELSGQPVVIDLRPMIERMVRDVGAGKRRGLISACFHNTMAAVTVEVCGRLRRSDGLERVCLSGGSFQNVYLVERTARLLQAAGFGVSLHTLVPPNDGGISLGQAVIANEWLRRGAANVPGDSR